MFFVGGGEAAAITFAKPTIAALGDKIINGISYKSWKNEKNTEDFPKPTNIE
jgi:hypothetical protein